MLFGKARVHANPAPRQKMKTVSENIASETVCYLSFLPKCLRPVNGMVGSRGRRQNIKRILCFQGWGYEHMINSILARHVCAICPNFGRVDAYRAYAYFRWVDDSLDAETGTRPERIAFVERQKILLERYYLGESPQNVSMEERMLVGFSSSTEGLDLVKKERRFQPGLSIVR